MQGKIESNDHRVEIIGVPNSRSDRELVADFIAEHAPGVDHHIDDAVEIWRHYEIVTQPAMVLVSSTGETEVLRLAQGRTGLWWRVRDLA